ncbi:MAG: GNAT family N-acetyltransferase [Halioglobus sp.]|nr:GNAT family N-acetyltransferase [Halioglobus sp.]
MAPCAPFMLSSITGQRGVFVCAVSENGGPDRRSHTGSAALNPASAGARPNQASTWTNSDQMIPDTVVYVVDSNGDLGAALGALLKNYSIRVEAHATTRAFLEQAEQSTLTNSCLLLALDSICEDGLPLVRQVHERLPQLPLIVLCDTPDDALRDRLIDAGAIDAIGKSLVDAYIFTRLSKLLPADPGLPVIKPSTMRLPDGTEVTFRMMSPDDVDIERRFIAALSDRSRYLRFFSGLREVPAYLLKRLVDPRFPVSYALIATIADDTGERQIGVARYAPTARDGVAEFAVVVADEWQGFGVASQLLHGIMTAATVAGIRRIEGLVLHENRPMLRLARKLGFEESPEKDDGPGVVKVAKNLRGAAAGQTR